MMPFAIRVLDMEQGDCTLIRCPDGTLVMVDCGSKSGFDSERQVWAQMLVREVVTQNNNTINALILTHPDKDHYNQIDRVCGRWNWQGTIHVQGVDYVNPRFNYVRIPTIYFSMANIGGNTGPLGNYTQNGVNNIVYTGGSHTNSIYEITINAATQQFRRWDSADNFTAIQATTPIVGNRHTIFAGNDNGTAWSVSIIAGNVPPPGGGGSPEEQKNHYSLVTLLEYGAHKGLILGDATDTTEAFLLATHTPLITNVDFVQAGHHGSETSSSANFVTTTNPSMVYISVENFEHSHFLPKGDRVTAWLNGLNNHPTYPQNHQIDYWVRDPNYQAGMQNQAHQVLQAWQTPGSGVHVYQQGNMYFYDPAQHDYGTLNNQNIAVYPMRGMMLYRASTNRKLRETSTNGAFDFQLG